MQLKLNLTGTVIGDDAEIISVEPDAGMFSVAGESDGEPIALNSRTYVDNYGVLHLQKTGITAGDTITVTAKSAYINPSGATTSYTATATVTATAPVAYPAKQCPVATDPYIEYTDTTEDVTASE